MGRTVDIAGGLGVGAYTMFILLMAFDGCYDQAPRQRTATEHCQARGYGEARVLDSNEIQCVQVTREVVK